MIKKYEEWLSESLSPSFQRSLDVVIYYCLNALSPQGGNNVEMNYRNWATLNPIFGTEGPDLWLNCGDFDGKIDSELATVEKALRNRVSPKSEDEITAFDVVHAFSRYGMRAEKISPDETIVHLITKNPDERSFWSPPKSGVPLDDVVEFYERTRPEGIEELRKKLGNILVAKRYGV